MKIIYNRKKTKIKDLAPGDLFHYLNADKDDVYIKTIHPDTKVQGAIYLKTGCVFPCGPALSDMVIKIENVELIIKE